MSSAIKALTAEAETASDRVLVAAVRWQRAIIAEHIANAAWYQSVKDEPSDTEQRTNLQYQEFQMAQAVTEGALAELGLAARAYAPLSLKDGGAEALHDDVVAAITDVQEGRESHVQWAAHLRNTTRHDCEGCTDHAAHIGEASYHDEWIEKYDRVIRLLALVPIATAPTGSSERRCGECGHSEFDPDLGYCLGPSSLRSEQPSVCGHDCDFPATKGQSN